MRVPATKPPPRLRWTKHWRSEYLEDDRCYTLAQMKQMTTFDFIVDISTSTITNSTESNKTQGRAKEGERATLLLLSLKGPNVQIQCAISIADGMLLHRLERGSIQKEQNAIYAEAEYQAAKASPGYRAHCSGKRIVVVLDNAPACQQTEK